MQGLRKPCVARLSVCVVSLRMVGPTKMAGRAATVAEFVRDASFPIVDCVIVYSPWPSY